MIRNSCWCLVFTFFSITASIAQSIDINGTVIVDDDEVEGIHIINKTAKKFTITNSLGNFSIPAKLNDTLIFSAIKYKSREIIITSVNIISKTLNVYLTELVNELDEIIVGKVLSWNLFLDVKNSHVKRDINFYDVGIPGYTGKPLTQSERRLKEAGVFKPQMLFGLLLGSVPLNPILNGISGRTKMLKNQVRLERMTDCLNSIKSNLSEVLFEYNKLDDELRTEFFYYCGEDPEFASICLIKNDILTLEFLKTKLVSFKTNLQN